MLLAYAPEYMPQQKQEMQITTMAAICGINPLIAADSDKVCYLTSGIPTFAGGLHRTSAAASKMTDTNGRLAFTMTNLRSLYTTSVTLPKTNTHTHTHTIHTLWHRDVCACA